MELRPVYPLRTARLLLRPLGSDDAEALFAYRSLDSVCRFVPFEPMDRAAITEKLESRWARSVITGEGQGLVLGIEVAESGQLVGDVMLFLQSELHRCGEIGWVLHPDHSGHGYATEAACELLRLGFDELGLHRVVARVDARNGSSIRLAERIGMRREAHLIRNEWFKGDWSDEIDFAILEVEWAARSQPGGA